MPLDNPISVSIIIPCRNEERFIRQCIESVLTGDTTNLDLEILAVDDSSTDRTREILQTLAHADSRVQVLDNPRQGKPRALNVGIRAARGEWIIRLDAHAEYPADYLQQCLATACRTGADNVGGCVIVQVRENTLQAQLVRALTTHRFGVGGSNFRIQAPEGPADTVPFGCYRRTVFEKIGYFDERLLHSQDFEFNQRLRRAGGTVWLNPGIHVLYYNQARLIDFFRKVIERDGPWNPWMWYLAPYSFRLRHAVPLLFVGVLIFLGVAAFFVPWGQAVLTAIVIFYGGIAILAAVQQSIRNRQWWLTVLLPWLFLIYHLSYGVGSLWGLVALALGKAPVQSQN